MHCCNNTLNDVIDEWQDKCFPTPPFLPLHIPTPGEVVNTIKRRNIPLIRPGVVSRVVNNKKEVYHYVWHALKNVKGLKPPQYLTVRPTAGALCSHSFIH